VVPAILSADVSAGVLQDAGSGTSELADAFGRVETGQTLFGVSGAGTVVQGRGRTGREDRGQQTGNELSDGKLDEDLQTRGAGGRADHRRGGGRARDGRRGCGTDDRGNERKKGLQGFDGSDRIGTGRGLRETRKQQERSERAECQVLSKFIV